VSFDDALRFTLHWEGGEVNDPRDPGGHTKFGISKRQFPDLDIGALTLEDASDIYCEKYWDPIWGDELPPSVAIAVFDFAVHSGVHRASFELQRAIGADRDGVVGPKTIDAANAYGDGPAALALSIVMQRTRFLARLAKARSQWAFVEGWMARCVALVGYIHDDLNYPPAEEDE
jgi:lysozyme family protein